MDYRNISIVKNNMKENKKYFYNQKYKLRHSGLTYQWCFINSRLWLRMFYHILRSFIAVSIEWSRDWSWVREQMNAMRIWLARFSANRCFFFRSQCCELEPLRPGSHARAWVTSLSTWSASGLCQDVLRDSPFEAHVITDVLCYQFTSNKFINYAKLWNYIIFIYIATTVIFAFINYIAVFLKENVALNYFLFPISERNGIK